MKSKDRYIMQKFPLEAVKLAELSPKRKKEFYQVISNQVRNLNEYEKITSYSLVDEYVKDGFLYIVWQGKEII